MIVDKDQENLLMKIREAHKHDDYKVDFELSEGYVLKKFNIHKGQLRSDIMTSGHLAKWLFFNNGLYQDKVAIDMGCGSGIHGVVMGLYGAKYVILTDLSEGATKNAEENVNQFGLSSISDVFQGDLFEKIQDKAGIIVFNHHFFSYGCIDNLTKPGFNISDCNDDELIHRFLEDAKSHRTKDGVIIMPYWHVAGETNDPGIQAPKHGYKVIQHKFISNLDLHPGQISIYELR